MVFGFIGTAQQVTADTPDMLSDMQINEIENRVNAMSAEQLLSKRADLRAERKLLDTGDESVEGDRRRLAEIAAELSAVQKAIFAVLGIGAINALTSDDYNDDVPPVITVNGGTATVELGSTYSDAGATAMDDHHGGTSVTSSGTVDTNTVGTYTITYTATDLSGNTATATRTVNVVDTTAPVVTVTGSNPATVELGGSYTDAGATATDASGAVTVVTTGVDTVKPDTLGAYTITYTSTDASGNVGTATRTVNVTDTTVPVFTSGSTYTVDEGAIAVGTVTATDIQSVTFSLSGSDLLQITTAGVLSFKSPADYESQSADPVTLPYDGSTYDVTATVTATDASSNAATQLVTVRIRDFGGIDDDDNTGTGTDTATGTSTGKGTGTGTGTGTDTATGTRTGTGTGTGTGTSTDTSSSTGTST